MKILFSKTDALGDQLWATGTVRSLLEQVHNPVVYWAVRPGNESIYTLLKGARLFLADQDCAPSKEADRLQRYSHSSLPDAPYSRLILLPVPFNPYAPHHPKRDVLLDIEWWVRFTMALNPDCAIAGSVTRNWVDHTLTLASHASRRIAYSQSIDSQPIPDPIIAILNRLGITRNLTDELPFTPDSHEGIALAKLAEPILGHPGGSSIELSGELFLPASNSEELILAPGAGDLDRIYPLHRMAEAVLELTLNRRFSTITVVQGPADTETARILHAELVKRSIQATIEVIDPSDLRPFAVRLASARLLLCNESFWVHLASFLGTPTVAVWGLGHWGRFVPQQGRITVLHTTMSCQHCNWLCCFAERHCITDIPVELLVSAAKERLEDVERSLPVRYQCYTSPRPESQVRRALYEQVRRSNLVVHERNRLSSQLAELQRNFELVEQDRAARKTVIEDQGRSLANLQADFDSKLRELRELYSINDRLRNECNLWQAKLGDLTRNFATAEADRVERASVIAEQGRVLAALQADHHNRLNELKQLYETNEELRNASNLLQAKLLDMTVQLQSIEADRIARGTVIEKQGERVSELERLVWLTEQDRNYWREVNRPKNESA